MVVRRTISLLRKLLNQANQKVRIFYLRAAFPGIVLPYSTSIGKGFVLSATDGGTLTIGNNVSFGRHSQVVVRGGEITIGDNVELGPGAIIVSSDNIRIGKNTLIAEYVVVRDQDHSLSFRPIRLAGFQTSAITIGEDCWLGSKSTVLRGSTIGDGAVIGAHALVRGCVPPYTLAVGCPAKVVKELPAP